MKYKTNLQTGFPSHFSYVFPTSTQICYTAQPVPGTPAPAVLAHPRAGTSGGTSLSRNSTYSQTFREALFPSSSLLGRPELLHAVILPSCSTCKLQVSHLLQTTCPEPGRHTRDKILTLKHSLCSLQQTNP